MSFEVDFSQPWLEETEPIPSPSLVPQVMEVTIAGRPYVLDTSFEPYRRDAFRHRSIQSQRESINLDNIPGVGTVNTEGLWRREAWDWSRGAGQPYQDRKDSLDNRFSTSKGINPWMQWQVELLNDTELLFATDDHDAEVLAVGQWLLLLIPSTGTVYRYGASEPTWTKVFTLSPFVPTQKMMATDGFNVWVAGSTGIWTADSSTTGGDHFGSWTHYVTSGNFDGIWWVGERLMTTTGPSVYNIVASGAPPSALWTHPNPNWAWSSMGQGSSQIYMAGFDATGFSNSVIYRSTIEPTGTNLTIPVQALPMEGGEWCQGLYGYLNFIFVGTNLGMRMCRTIAAYDPTGNEGDLEAGPLLPGLFPPGPVSSPVYDMVGNNRFVYFSWGNYDAESTGIGRCDLSTFIDTQAPAFTSDLMVQGQGDVISLDWSPVNQAPVFVVRGLGLYGSTQTPVASGYVKSGYVGYGISDDKIAMAGDIGTVQPQQGTVTMSLATDAGNNIFAFVGQQVSASAGGSPNQSAFGIGAIRGENYQVQLTLLRDPVTNQSPIMNRWTLKAIPGITAGVTISVVLRMWTTEEIAGQDYYFDGYNEYAFLENLRTTQTIFAYTEGPYVAPYCTVDEIDWLPEKRVDAQAAGGFQGNIIVYIKTWSLTS